MPAHFSRDLFRFLAELRDHNERDWFAANKERYEKQVRDPILRFIADVEKPLHRISSHFVADPRPVGGSLFRIYRDTRFSKDKSPYKIHMGIHFFHESAKKAPSVPGFYLHLQPGESFVAGGIWHPEPPALAKLRDAIVASTPEWKALKKSKLPIEGGALKRPPKGYPANHPELEMLKRTDFVASARYSDKDVCSSDFLSIFIASCKELTPLVRFTTGAVGLPF